jgi:hypothetical protein
MVELKRDGEIGASRDPGLFGELVRVMGVPETLEQARRYER